MKKNSDSGYNEYNDNEDNVESGIPASNSNFYSNSAQSAQNTQDSDEDGGYDYGDYDEDARVVSTEHQYQDEESNAELSLRPKMLKEYIGQDKVKENLKIFIDAAKERNESLDHVLLYGPPGLGKTTLASIIANEMNVSLKTMSGPAIERPGDLVAILTSLAEGDVLFIDEIHRLSRIIEEVLYSAMEDRRVDIIIGKGPAARSIPIDLAKFTLVGATTRSGQLSAPLRDRFGIISRLDLYTTEQLAIIVKRSSSILGIEIDESGANEIASRSRGTPRIANRILKRVRDYAQVRANGIIDQEVADKALTMYEIDKLGLDSMDRRMLEAIIKYFDGGPVGLDTLAATINEESVTIEDVYEPFLMQIGFLNKTPRGRCATRGAYEHLKMEYRPVNSSWQVSFDDEGDDKNI